MAAGNVRYRGVRRPPNVNAVVVQEGTVRCGLPQLYLLILAVPVNEQIGQFKVVYWAQLGISRRSEDDDRAVGVVRKMQDRAGAGAAQGHVVVPQNERFVEHVGARAQRNLAALLQAVEGLLDLVAAGGGFQLQNRQILGKTGVVKAAKKQEDEKDFELGEAPFLVPFCVEGRVQYHLFKKSDETSHAVIHLQMLLRIYFLR